MKNSQICSLKSSVSVNSTLANLSIYIILNKQQSLDNYAYFLSFLICSYL